MRITIRLDDDLLAEVQLLGVRSGRPMTGEIEDALRETLARRRPVEEREPVRLTTVLGNGLPPGVDLDDSAALLSMMDESYDPARCQPSGVPTPRGCTQPHSFPWVA